MNETMTRYDWLRKEQSLGGSIGVKSMIMTMTKKPRVMLVVWIATAILLVLTAINVAVSYRNTMKSVYIALASKSMQEAENIARGLDVPTYKELAANPSREHEAYRRLQQQLEEARLQMGALYVYTLQIEENPKVGKTLLTAHPPDFSQPFDIGKICNVTAGQIEQVQRGSSYYSDVIHDPLYGEYVSAGAPIRDHTGEVIGILGIDVSTDTMHSIGSEVVRSSMFTFLFNVMFVALLLLVFFLLQGWYRRELKLAVGDAERTYQDEIRSVIASMRSVRHDFVNHMQVLYGLIECGYHDKARDYIGTLIRDAKILDLSVRVQNPALMVLFHTKWEQAQSRRILMQFEVEQHPFDRIPSVDLIKILSNLLDNAIEASEEADGQKYIRISCQAKESAYWFTVENSGKEIRAEHLKSIFQEGVTTKQGDDDLPRGVGLTIVKEVVRKYHGDIDVRSERGTTQFCVRLQIPGN
ncbi:GHKL domain-containing protein [Brevibacillus ruminantium]|uniref:GHKL domain-containing protein n=1 Tax=Brevibacillus ruminantium TaxID=2950604 RepID=A0ABY4WAK9_9BACL|nr:GHKL domain-containing protein [Brevibacillus ruminantium]USG64200.1 GHKL domain-containing protein [Brevibacillus ruminantium]